MTPDAVARDAATAVFEATHGINHRVAVILGSGWSGATDAIGDCNAELELAALPGFSDPSVPGHGGTLRSVSVGNNRALVFGGRTHLYEGRGTDAVVHAVRTAAAAGAKTVILTNAAGSVRREWAPGTTVLIRDHINLTGTSPLSGPEFIDMTEAYSTRLRELVRQLRPDMPEGVYAQFRGPQYETPAEIAMVRALGGDLVGMSTVLETIAARAAGLEVLGLSLVTNAAAGVTGAALDHHEVVATGLESTTQVGSLLADILSRI